jgi:hypothetical protein
MDALFQIIYTSTANGLIGNEELKEMLKGSVQRNKRAGITGLLLFKDGCFMQVLEGEEATVKTLFSKICRDRRHRNIMPLIQETIRKRQFPDSAMAFPDLGAAKLRELPGYSDFLNTPLNGDLFAKDISKCQKILLYFKKNIR